eukprot:gene11568-14170_t
MNPDRDLDKIGVHCHLKDCNLLDFLPFTCDGCKKMFCLEHKDYGEHKCPSPPVQQKGGTTIECRLCESVLNVPYAWDPNAVLRDHQKKGCPKKPAINAHKCTFDQCPKSEAIKIVCPTCKNNFCLKHRFERDHKCPKLRQFQAPVKSIGPFQIIDKSKSIKAK